MIRSNLLAALALTIGCRAVPMEKADTTVGHNLEDTAGQTDTAENTGDTVTETDSGTTEDTVSDTATAPDCEFEVATWVTGSYGTTILPNELEVTVNDDSPAGEMVPGFGEVLALDYTVVHPECPAFGILSHGIYFAAEVANTEWLQSMVNKGAYAYDEADDFLATFDSRNAFDLQGGDNATLGFSPMIAWCEDTNSYCDLRWIEGGETLTVYYYATTTGAAPGDRIEFGLQIDQIQVAYGEAGSAWLAQPSVEGNELSF